MTGTAHSALLVQDMHTKRSSRRTRGMSRSTHNVRSQFIQKLGICPSTSPHHAERSVRDLRHIPRFRQQLQYDRDEERLYLEQRKSRQLSSSPTSNGELAHALSGKAKQRKQVKFQEGVIVAPIPMRNEYSDRTRSKLWDDPEELQGNIARNLVEFSAENCNWWLACHEDEMYKCGVTGDLIHPVHVDEERLHIEQGKSRQLSSSPTSGDELAHEVSDADDNEDEDYTESLPPIVTIKEEDSSPNFMLTPLQMNALRDTILPPVLHHRPWRRIYSLLRDGDSFVAFQKTMTSWNLKQGNQSSLLVVKTTAGEMIGGYADFPLVPLASCAVGSASGTCLFKLRTGEDCKDPAMEVYGKNLLSSKKIIFDPTRRIIAFGGDGNGGLNEGFGLCLEDGFTRGTTARCPAFHNEPLVSDQDGVFDVLDVEVWGFVFGQFF